MLCSTGYRKPIESLTLSDQNSLKSSLLNYHLLYKSETDQFIQGLETAGVLTAYVLHLMFLKVCLWHLTLPVSLQVYVLIILFIIRSVYSTGTGFLSIELKKPVPVPKGL